jgi:cysteinyl-tRNA synthetase
MDLMFPHHENERAQSESATGQPFARYWLHNGLTRFNTKKISGSDAATEEGRKVLASVAAKKLIEEYGPDLLRYMLLSTHYRSPIDFREEVIAAARKGLGTYQRLLERVERMRGEPLNEKQPTMDQAAGELYESNSGPFARAVLAHKMKFLEIMDDDFNTAGGIATLHELAGEINSFIESNRVEKEKQSEALQAVAAAAQTFKQLATVLGFFRTRPAQATSSSHEKSLADDLMKLLISLRQEARESKNFALADSIRKKLTAIGVTLEDRADGTIWRKE